MSSLVNVIEVFSGIQGEGIYVGRRQVFVRLAGCNLACEYCDTPEPRQLVLFAMVEAGAGVRRFDRMENPFDARRLAGVIEVLDGARRHDAVSLTGGEPLLAADFIAELIPLCGGRRFYLETNGSLPGQFEKVAALVHTVAMDIKLASAAGRATDREVARRFLSLAVAREVFVKVVVTDRTTGAELAEAAGTVASVRADVPFVIQPVTPGSFEVQPPDEDHLLELQMAALAVLRDVRVIPQVHRLMGQR